MINLLRKISKNAGIYLLIPYVSLFIFLTAKANMNLAHGRYALSMDEQITFDGVNEILHPESFYMFIFSIIDGRDQRYGRILWNLSAAFSYVPEKLFGVSGQIIATRTMSVLLIILAAGIISKALSKTTNQFSMIFVVVLSVPSVSYYSTMPKPEPLQLFFLSTLVYLLIKRNEGSSTKFFLIAGVSLGIKISSIFIVGPLVIWILLTTPSFVVLGRRWLLERFGYFSLGMGIAVPTLLPTLGMIFGTILFWDYFAKSNRTRFAFFPGALILSIANALVLDEGFERLIKRPFFQNWLNYTVFGSQHGSDSVNVGPQAWFQYIINDWSNIGPWLFWLVTVTTVFHLSMLWASNGLKLMKQPLLAVVIASLIYIIGIALGVHRLWGFYLYVGMTLFITAIIGIHTLGKDFTSTKVLRQVVVVSQLVVLFAFSFNSSKENFVDLHESSLRTQSADYLMQMKSYEIIQKTIYAAAKTESSPLKVALDPNYFQLEDVGSVPIERFWGPFTGWGDYDLVVLKESHLPSSGNQVIGTREENARNVEIEMYNRLVSPDSLFCDSDVCYFVLKVLPDNGRILRLVAR